MRTLMKMKFTALMIGCTFLISFFLIVSATFLSAYLQPNKMITVSVNTIGEADLELAMILLSLPLQVYSVTYVFRKIVDEAVEDSIVKRVK